MFDEFIYYLLNMSIIGIGVMAVILIIRLVFKKWLTKNVVLLLWMFVLIRLVVPFAVGSDYSLIGMFDESVVRTVPISDSDADNAAELLFSNTIQQVDSYVPLTYKSTGVAEFFRWIGVVWLIGALVIGVIVYASSISFRKSLKMIYLKKCKGVDVYHSEHIKSPLIIGVARPRIILPSDFDETIESFALLHEYTHIVRRDNLWKFLATIITVIHWFNPFCWWALRQFSRDIELACDESVIKKLAKESVKDYALALVAANEQMKNYVTAFSGNRLGERVQAIVAYRRLSKAMMVVLVVLYAILFVTLLTSCSDKGVEVEDECYETYEMSLKEVETMVRHFHENELMGEPKSIRLIDYQEENKVGMFFEDLCYIDGKYYLFDSRNDEVSAYGYDYIKIVRSEKSPSFGHVILTNDMNTTGDDVFMSMVSSMMPMGQPEFRIVLFLPRGEELPTSMD